MAAEDTPLYLDLIGKSVGPVVGFLLGVIAGNWRRGLRWVRRAPDVQIHVEKDPRIIYANMPNWITFPQFVPRTADSLPPPPVGSALGMTEWASNLDGLPAEYCDLRVTIIAWDDRDVVVDGLRVEVAKYEIPPGVVLVNPVGGASMESRRLDVELSLFAPTVIPKEPGGSPTDSFAFQLKAGERAQFNLHVKTPLEGGDHADAFQWTGLLYLLVGNKRRTVKISDGGKAFVLVNRDRRPELWWSGGAWVPRDTFFGRGAE